MDGCDDCIRRRVGLRCAYTVWIGVPIAGLVPKKALSLAVGETRVTHALLFMGYGLYKAHIFGDVGLLAYAALVGFMPIILAAIASRFFKPESLRPVHLR